MAAPKFVNGYFNVPRSEFYHPFLSEEREYTKREAWLDICSRACFRQLTVRVKVRNGYQNITLNPSELIATERTLAEDWRWSNSKVKRFLDDIEALGWIKRLSSSPVNVIQVRGKDEAADDEAQNAAQSRPQRKPSKSVTSPDSEGNETAQKAAQNAAPKNKDHKKDQNKNTLSIHTSKEEVSRGNSKSNLTRDIQSFLTQLKNWYILSKKANWTNYVTEDYSALDIRNDIQRLYGHVVSLKDQDQVTEGMIPVLEKEFSRFGFVYQTEEH